MPLIYITAPNIFYTFELPVVSGAEVYVGTAPNCQLSLPGVEGLGEVHACISCQPQGYVITDMGTPYGTLANGVPIQSDYLCPGVEYRLGAAIITAPAEEAAVPQQQPVMMPQQVVQQPVAQQPAAAATATKKPTLKKKSPLKSGTAVAAKPGAAAKPAGGADAADMADRFKRKGDSTTFNLIYVIVLIAAAVYAGLALRHWQKTGNFLPGIVADGEPSK